MKSWTYLTLAILLFFPSPKTYAQFALDDLNLALTKLDEGIMLTHQGDPQSGPTLSEASALLEQVIVNHQIRTPEIYHALGNAYLLNDRLGHAILAYRRGEQADPTNLQIQNSLEYARSTLSIHVPPNPTNRAWNTLLAWRGHLPKWSLWLAFVIPFTTGWIIFSAQVFQLGKRNLNLIGIWLIIASIVPIGLLGLDWWRNSISLDVVITSTLVSARSGPDHEIYDLVFDDDLQAGVEAEQIEERDNWLHLKLADGSECWVPTNSADPVNP